MSVEFNWSHSPLSQSRSFPPSAVTACIQSLEIRSATRFSKSYKRRHGICVLQSARKSEEDFRAMQRGFRVPRAPGREIPRKMALFPTESTNIYHMRTEYNYPELRDLYGRQDIYPFIIYLDGEIVYIKKVGWTDKMVANLDRLAKDAGGRTIDPSKTSWNTVARTLSRDSKTAQYCDRRQCYVFNNNYFLVKSGFTFGQK